LEKLNRTNSVPTIATLLPEPALSFRRPDDPLSIVNAMQEYQAMLDATRDGLVKKEPAEIPADRIERSNHLKSFGYYCDAAMVGICEIPTDCWRETAIENPDVTRLAEKVRTMQPKSLATGIDLVMAGLRDAMRAPPTDCSNHTHAIVFLYDHPRAPKADETGCDWLTDALDQRACLRGMETSVSLANYIRVLGYEARAHSGAASNVHMNKLAVLAGLATVNDGNATNPFLGRDFGLSVITQRWNCRLTVRLARPRNRRLAGTREPAVMQNLP